MSFKEGTSREPYDKASGSASMKEQLLSPLSNMVNEESRSNPLGDNHACPILEPNNQSYANNAAEDTRRLLRNILYYFAL